MASAVLPIASDSRRARAASAGPPATSSSTTEEFAARTAALAQLEAHLQRLARRQRVPNAVAERHLAGRIAQAVSERPAPAARPRTAVAFRQWLVSLTDVGTLIMIGCVAVALAALVPLAAFLGDPVPAWCALGMAMLGALCAVAARPILRVESRLWGKALPTAAHIQATRLVGCLTLIAGSSWWITQ